MDFSINEVARLAGTTSRTLRHYHQLGLLVPSRVGTSGYRYYDQESLIRLQRILLLRELGLGLPRIAEVLAGQLDDASALQAHLQALATERARLERQMASVQRTIVALKEKETLMPEEILDGFDHSQYAEEVTQRWGFEAYAKTDRWWRGLGADGQQSFRARSQDLSRAWIAAFESGADPADADVQELAGRHIEWVALSWGRAPSREELAGLAEMYVQDERFAANYGGPGGAGFVRAALICFADAS